MAFPQNSLRCLKGVFIITIMFLLASACQTKTPQDKAPKKVRVGLDRLDEFQDLFAGKRVGIITNHTAYDSKNQHITKIFLGLPNVQVTALFGPEHGIRGHAEAGEKVDTEDDPLRGIPIYSLYGKTRKPTAEMLKNVDVLVFDIQDVGARFYTYIWTMAYAMEAAAEQGKQFVVLDRPNPISGSHVEGNILEPGFSTFVGLFPIPVRHGMTVGELARLFNGEGWLAKGVQVELTVVPLKNWRRKMWFDETGLPFIKPSPNIPDLTSATTYPGTCLLEGVNVSEGRGTQSPFRLFGAPWISRTQLTDQLNALGLPGVAFRDTVFTPVSIPGASTNPKYKDRRCQGAKIIITDRDAFMPYLTGIQIVNAIRQMYPDSLQWRVRHFDRLCGTNKIRKTIEGGGDIEKMVEAWQGELQAFMAKREKYLLYD